MVPSASDDDLERLCSLDDPTRRRLYDLVAAQDSPVSRDEAAAALGLERATAAYHLDRLVGQGLLAASYARPEGVGGPGAGRPAKHYAPVEGELSVSLPPRDYHLAAELLARAAERDDSGALGAALADAAAGFGAELADRSDDDGLVAVLERQGFAPYQDGDVVRLRNCPFHRLAREHTELVCGMNLALLGAVAERLAADVEVELDPSPDRCCVAFHLRT